VAATGAIARALGFAIDLADAIDGAKS
jgi:hypothetical protein